MALPKEALRPYYLIRPRLWAQPIDLIDSRSMVSRRWRYVYLRVPKAANSTVARSLLERFPEPGLDPADAKGRTAHLGDLRPWELPRVARYFTFTVVRDPYARTLSAFLDKFVASEAGKRRANLGATVAEHDAGRLSFRAFCRYLAAGGEATDAHWMRQSRIVGLADRLDLVARVERLEADLAEAMSRIAGRAEPAAVRRAGPPPTRASERLDEHYDAECLRIVTEVYAEDFRRFGYATREP